MLFGILNMPYDMAMRDEISRFQYHARGKQACEIIKQLTAERDAARIVGAGLAELLKKTSTQEAT